jgi:hypothetical protein
MDVSRSQRVDPPRKPCCSGAPGGAALVRAAPYHGVGRRGKHGRHQVAIRRRQPVGPRGRHVDDGPRGITHGAVGLSIAIFCRARAGRSPAGRRRGSDRGRARGGARARPGRRRTSGRSRGRGGDPPSGWRGAGSGARPRRGRGRGGRRGGSAWGRRAPTGGSAAAAGRDRSVGQRPRPRGPRAMHCIAWGRAMRRALQEGQTPRPLQEKATRRSAAQSSHRIRAKPWARMPQRR